MQVMVTSLKSIAESHADHRYWQSELDMWTVDIANWKSEQADALIELKRIADEIYEQGKCLDEHGKSIASLRSGLQAHEEALADLLETGVEGDVVQELSAHHSKHAANHAQRKEVHERIKKHHHRAMAQVAMLKATMEAAM
jgi:chromosome segregation ATPase